MKKKIKADQQESSSSEEEKTYFSLVHRMTHPGEAAYQLLVKWGETNKLLERIANAEEKRNELMLEEESDDEETGEDETGTDTD